MACIRIRRGSEPRSIARRRFAWIALPLLAACFQAQADTAVLSASRDTTLYEPAVAQADVARWATDWAGGWRRQFTPESKGT